MIVTFTPNPALDKTVVVPGFALGTIFRTADVQSLAGGKGFNVARSLRVLGYEPLVVAPLAGYIGQMIDALARAEGMRSQPIWFDGETRTCLSIVDPESGNVSEIYEAGPMLPAEAWERTLQTLRQHLVPGDILTVSGGFPRGVPDDALKQIAKLAHNRGARPMFDAYGAQLRNALVARPTLVKCNAAEAGGVLDREVDGVGSALAAAADLQQRGACAVVITLGARGAVGIDEHGNRFAWQAPTVRSVSAVGSGDATFAAIALTLEGGATLAEATRYGVAAGAANTLRTGAGKFERMEARDLIAEVHPIAEYS